jgi:4-amino-4-deoxy-L-arabinose transferase-like glycosyltransferase
VLLTVAVRDSPSAAVLVSAVAAAVVVLLVQPRVGSPDHQPVQGRGAAAGLIALSPGCLHLFAAHAPDRAYIDGGRVRVLGPAIPLVMWVMLLAAALGIVAAASARIVGQLPRVRRPIACLRVLSFQQWFALILAASFILRVAALFTVNDARRDAGDPYYYHVTANLLARGRGFWDPVAWVDLGAQLPGAKHGPVLPWVLSLWSRVGGTGYVDHQVASVVLGLPQVAAVMLLARLLAGHRAAVLAGALAAVYPNIWVSDGILFSEGLMAGFTTFATLVAYHWRTHPTKRSIALLGALVGAAALTRGEAVLLIPLLLVPLALGARVLTRRERWRHLMVGVGTFAATLAPWAAYNTGRFEQFVPLSTNSNEVLFFANCDDTYSGPLLGFWSFDCIKRYQAEHGEPEGDESQVSEFYRDRAIEYAKDNSNRLPVVVAARVGRQWELFRPQQAITFAWLERRPRQALKVGLGMYYAMMALAVSATFCLRRRRVAVWPLWTHALSVTITAAYAYGTLRFRAPFEPLLCVLAAVGVVELTRWPRHRPSANDASAPASGG